MNEQINEQRNRIKEKISKLQNPQIIDELLNYILHLKDQGNLPTYQELPPEVHQLF